MRTSRTIEPVDLIVAVGLVATLLGGSLLFMATSGVLEAAGPEPASITNASGVGFMDEREWVQPVLGQAIVEDYLLETSINREITRAVHELNRSSMFGHGLRSAPFGHFDRIREQALAIEADHAARVQFVLGRAIVEFTARGVRTGALSPAQYQGEFNRRFIERAKTLRAGIEKRFQETWQARLGEMIVAASQDRDRVADRTQERVGAAVIEVTRIQDGYQGAKAGIQDQLGALVFAATIAEDQADRLARLATAGPVTQVAALPLTQPRTWPEIPVGFLLAASAVLIGLFLAGLSMPAIRPEAAEVGAAEPEMVREAARKIA